MELTHGGDIYSYQETHGGALPLDLSANINPFGISAGLREAMRAAIDACEHYPDPLCRALRRAIARREAVDPAHLYCGAGAADVLFRFAAAVRPRSALLTAPTFSEYEGSLAGCALRFHALRREEGFAVTARILAEITREVEAVYLCNPNNPTGRTVDMPLLREIAEACHAQGIWLVVDECFLDFTQDGEARTLKALLKRQPKLVLLRAFTKMYAIPGVRLGYCMTANDTLLDALYRVGQPWNVSVIAQACGVAACAEDGLARETARETARERVFLQQALRTRGFEVFDSEANFLLFHTEEAALGARLAREGVLIRDCANYRGLFEGDYRVAVRRREDSVRFLRALDMAGRS